MKNIPRNQQNNIPKALLLVLVIAAFYAVCLFISGKWKLTMNNGDSCGYYIHATSAFIHHDVGNYEKSLQAMIQEYPESKSLLNDPFWMKETKIGRKAIKYSVGVAALQSPALLLAHMYATFHPKYESNGWSRPYILMQHIFQIGFIAIAFYFLYLMLCKYFPTRIVAITLLVVALGTNLFIQANTFLMAHTYQFFNLTMLIWFTIKFYERPSMFTSLGVGIFAGLMAICRIPEVIVVIVPIFWGVYNVRSLRKRITFIGKHIQHYIPAIIVWAIILSVQLIYWKYVSGSFIFNAYEGEGFNFLKPHIFKGWFSYQNGWLVYTPIMILSLLGLLYTKKYVPQVIIPTILFLGINTYVHYSYYTWNYFPGLGSRPMIDAYPLLAFSLATFIASSFKKSFSKVVASVLLIGFIALNLFQTWQSHEGIINSDSSNRTFFWESMGKTSSSKAILLAHDINEKQPDEHKLNHVRDILVDDFESEDQNNALANSGSYSLKIDRDSAFHSSIFKFEEEDVKAGDYIKVEFDAFVSEENFNYDRYSLSRFVVRFMDETQKERKWKGLSIQRFIGNASNSIWHIGTPNKWEKISWYVRVPKSAKENWELEAFVLNPHNHIFYIDDLTLSLYRHK